MSADSKFEKDLLEATAPKKPKEGEAVEKTVDDLLKSTLSGLGLDAEKRKQILAGIPEAAKPEPKMLPPPKPPVVEKKEPAPRADVIDIKPQEKGFRAESLSWLKEPVIKHEPPPRKAEPPLFKPEPPVKKAEPPVLKDKEKEVFPPSSKKEESFLESYAKPPKKKSRPIVPIAAGALVIIAAGVIFLVMGGKKKPAVEVQHAVTTAVPIPAPTDAASTLSESGTTTPPPVKETKTQAEKPVAERPAQPAERKPTAEASNLSDSSTAPLVPLDQGATRVQEIKPTRTQPTPAEEGKRAATGTGSTAGPKTTLGQLVPITQVDTPPGLVRRVEPDYPPLANRMKAEGAVTVNALIDETGAVIRTEVLKQSGGPYGFEKASRDAVMKWKFKPAVKDGTYVKVWMTVVVNFTIKK